MRLCLCKLVDDWLLQVSRRADVTRGKHTVAVEDETFRGVRRLVLRHISKHFHTGNVRAVLPPDNVAEKVESATIDLRLAFPRCTP